MIDAERVRTIARLIANARASSNLARYDSVRYGLRVNPLFMYLSDVYSAPANLAGPPS